MPGASCPSSPSRWAAAALPGGVGAQGLGQSDALLGQPAPKRLVGIGVAAGDGGVDSVDGIDIGNGGVGAEGQGGAGIQKRAEGPHIRDALGPQIALRATGPG